LTTAEKVARYASVPLAVESELGRRNMSVREILSLAPGSLIKLTGPIGSQVDLYVGGAPFGSGEMIRVGGSLAVRMTKFANQNPD
jgi:flagellar motor switch protein FliN/FliY